jgi:hypothetical protein
MDWIPSLHLPHLTDGWLAQTPPTAEVELLRQQLEFLKAENARLGADFADKLRFIAEDNKNLSDRFSQFVTTMQFVLGLFAVIAGVGAYFLGKSFDESKKLIKQQVELQIADQIRQEVNARIDVVRRSLQRETIISNISVDYVLPEGRYSPDEVELLKTRQFKDVEWLKDVNQLKQSQGDIVVLDLVNWSGSNRQEFDKLPEEVQQQGKEWCDRVVRMMPTTSTLVLYVRGRFPLPADKPVVAVNTQITLVGMVADAAYVVYAKQQN